MFLVGGCGVAWCERLVSGVVRRSHLFLQEVLVWWANQSATGNKALYIAIGVAGGGVGAGVAVVCSRIMVAPGRILARTHVVTKKKND